MAHVRSVVGRIWIASGLALAGFLGLSLPASAQDPNPMNVVKAPNHPLDQPIAWITDAGKFFQSVNDYTCTLLTQERIQGRLMDENFIQARFRNQPFSVYMRWLSPAKLNGQEMAYIHGRNGNRMRVRPKGGIKPIAGVVDISPNDRRVREHSNHTILEAGLGNLIDHLGKSWHMERQINKCKVDIQEFQFANRPCFRVEIVHIAPDPNFIFYRTVNYLDQQTKIPLRTENYLWPQPGDKPDGELYEMFSFVNLRFNQNLGENNFVVR